MELTLTNYKTILPKDLLKAAEKHTVRECDETEKGSFVAYIDEGDDSFDATIKVSAKGDLIAHSCDCKNGTLFCKHQAALLLHIAGTKKAKPQPAKPKKSANAFESLLEEAAPEKLREWIKELLTKNKDLQLAFTHHFTAARQFYTPKEAEQLTAEAIKAVVKNKKNIDPTELKRIIGLWHEMHAPVMKAYAENVSDETGFLAVHAVIESYLKFDDATNTGSNKITKHIEDLLQKQTEAINSLYNDEAWEKAVGYFVAYLYKDSHSLRLHYLLHLRNIISLSSEERRAQLIDILVNQYNNSFRDRLSNEDVYTKTLFYLVEQYHLLYEYNAVFKPVHYDNDYNKKLISILIENKNYELAETYCQQQVAGNYREEYNVLYWSLLTDIYRFTNNEAKLSEILLLLIPHTFDFDDFLYVYARMTDEEAKKKWRTKLLTKSRNNYNGNKAAGEFCFRLMDYEKKYKKMIEYIDANTRYDTILTFFESMLKADKALLIQAIIDKSDDRLFYMHTEDENDTNCFPDLLATILKHYGINDLKFVIKQKESRNSWLNNVNRFTRYMKKELYAESNEIKLK